MDFAGFYLGKYSDNTRLIPQNPDPDLGFIVVIPAYKEENLMLTLGSLHICSPIRKSVEVIIVINAPENASAEILDINKRCLVQAEKWIEKHSKKTFSFHIIQQLFPPKHAGVGLARKTGMDEAVRRFNSINNPHGVIIGFDADCTCEENYLVSIENLFLDNPKINGCSVFYEHPLEGKEYTEDIYHSILLYELYLRYYIEILRWCRYPFAYHTLGSSFAVSLKAYCLQGGMNKLKAGEDFYFLNKIIPQGNYAEINGTTVFPSPRVSDRVPFGTGAAISKMILTKDKRYDTFNPDAFYLLKGLFDEVEKYYTCDTSEIEKHIEKIPEPLRSFMIKEKASGSIINARENSASLPVFRKRFFQWMNGLNVLHYLHYAHEKHFSKIPVSNASRNFIIDKIEGIPDISDKDLLLYLRHRQRLANYQPEL